MNRTIIKYISAVFTLIIILLQSCVKNDSYSADVIIYGGTSAAVTAAVEVVRLGKT